MSPSAFGDVNGDGKQDIAGYLAGNIRVSRSNGNGTFSTVADLSDGSGGTLYLVDVNGDGYADLIRHNKDESTIYVRLYESGSFSSTRASTIGVTYQDISLADINGDGLTDLSVNQYGGTTTKIYVYLSKGNGRFLDPIQTNVSATGRGVYYGDVNGDGRSDLLIADTSDRIRSCLSAGNGSFKSPLTTASGSAGNIYVAEFNRDGKSDIIANYATSAGNTVKYHKSYLSSEGNPRPDLLKKVTTDTGARISFAYQSSKSYTPTEFPFVLQIVKSISVNDGLDNISTATFDYTDGLYNYATREFRGFKTITRTNPDNSISLFTYHQGEYLRGKLLSEGLWEPGEDPATDTPLIETTYAWEREYLDPPANTTAFAKLASQRTDVYDASPAYAQQDFIYDSGTGNPLAATTFGTGAEAVTTELEWQNFDTWIWRQTKETVTGADTGKVRETLFEYQTGTGNLTAREGWLATGTNPREIYLYDAYGNRTHVTDARGNTTVTEYDAATATYPVRVTLPATNGVTHVVESAWDTRFGQKLWYKDENLQITQYAYDPFGRVAQVDFPDGGRRTVEYVDNVVPHYTVTRVTENASGTTIDTYRYLDGLNREKQTVTFGEAGQPIVSRAFHDLMGRLWCTRGPFFAAGSTFPQAAPTEHPWKKIYFDYRGRPVTEESPHGQYGTIVALRAYNGLTTTLTDPDGSQKIERRDYLGRITRVTEINDSTQYHTNYDYNAAGDLLAVTDSASNTTAIVWDTLGRKLDMTDPDMGTWAYTYDANGNLLTQTDAKDQTIIFTYDALNRVTYKSYSTSDPAVAFLYDNPSVPSANGRGRPHAVATTQVTTTFEAYDPMGRLLRESKLYAGIPTPGITQYAYDLSGKQLRVTHPDNFYVDNHYYPGANLLQTVTGSNGVVFATLTQYQPTGKMGRLNHANGTETVYTYDPLSTKLTSLITTGPGSTTLQERAYLYSPAGDIEQITDGVSGMTYTYTYDDLHRLTSAADTGLDPPITYAYDAIGNMTEQAAGADLAAYTYASAHPHAVSSIAINGTPRAFSYDANGNLTAGPDFAPDPSSPVTRTLTWNADNMPLSITRAGRTTSLHYDGLGRRAKKVVSGGGSTTYYVTEGFEVIDETAIAYVFAGNLRVAKVADGVTSYFHKDHLGSSTVMTNNSGTVVEASGYMPFGEFRSHSGTFTSSYKFTDQELDSESGFYNYDARLYDPVIGRFISADPLVLNPIDPQSLNRYSYCHNNPLIYIDPSGYTPEDPNPNDCGSCNDPAPDCQGGLPERDITGEDCCGPWECYGKKEVESGGGLPSGIGEGGHGGENGNSSSGATAGATPKGGFASPDIGGYLGLGRSMNKSLSTPTTQRKPSALANALISLFEEDEIPPQQKLTAKMRSALAPVNTATNAFINWTYKPQHVAAVSVVGTWSEVGAAFGPQFGVVGTVYGAVVTCGICHGVQAMGE
jgi:RHS repeat-associated protein